MSFDPWLAGFDSCDKLGQEIMEKINYRNRHPKGSAAYGKESASVRTDLIKFAKDVDNLQQTLIRAGTQRRITDREGDRRQAMVDQLLTRKRKLEEAFKHEDNRGQRSDLMGPMAGLDEPWGRREVDPMADSNNPFTSIGDIRQQQQQIIREQDAGLDALSEVLSRQRQMAVDIGAEVDVQNDIIEDITDHMDTTNRRLIRETKHVKLVTRKANTCWYWVVIVLLFIGILVIVIIPKA